MSQDKIIEHLLELANPVDRRTRAETLDRALRTALMLMDGDAAVILTSGARRGERLVLHAGSAIAATLRLPPEGSEVVRTLAETAEPLVLVDLVAEPQLATDGCPGVEAGPAIFVPMRQRDPRPAYVGVYRKRGRAKFTLGDTRVMMLFAAWLSGALEQQRLATGMQRLAVTDDLTEIYNYRFLKTALRREMKRASRFSQPLSLILIDVDELEWHREGSGQLRSSVLLKEVATALAPQVRSFDLLARYGDEEFLLVLPQTTREAAADVAERMRVTIEGHAFPSAGRPVTVSLGVASFPQDGVDVHELVARSERALQQAKARGRNCVATLDGKAA